MISLAYGRHAFLHARLGALKGELLSKSAWHQLLEADSFAEQRQLLTTTNYAPWLGATSGVTCRGIHAALFRIACTIERSVSAESAGLIRVLSAALYESFCLSRYRCCQSVMFFLGGQQCVVQKMSTYPLDCCVPRHVSQIGVGRMYPTVEFQSSSGPLR
jgi:hypothetical protein